MVTFLSDPALVKQLRTDKAFNINFLKENHGIGEEDIDEGRKFMIKAISLCDGYSEITADAEHISLINDGSTYQWGLAKDDVTPNDIFRAWREGGRDLRHSSPRGHHQKHSVAG